MLDDCEGLLGDAGRRPRARARDWWSPYHRGRACAQGCPGWRVGERPARKWRRKTIAIAGRTIAHRAYHRLYAESAAPGPQLVLPWRGTARRVFPRTECVRSRSTGPAASHVRGERLHEVRLVLRQRHVGEGICVLERVLLGMLLAPQAPRAMQCRTEAACSAAVSVALVHGDWTNRDGGTVFSMLSWPSAAG